MATSTLSALLTDSNSCVDGVPIVYCQRDSLPVRLLGDCCGNEFWASGPDQEGGRHALLSRLGVLAGGCRLSLNAYSAVVARSLINVAKLNVVFEAIDASLHDGATPARDVHDAIRLCESVTRPADLSDLRFQIAHVNLLTLPASGMLDDVWLDEKFLIRHMNLPGEPISCFAQLAGVCTPYIREADVIQATT